MQCSAEEAGSTGAVQSKVSLWRRNSREKERLCCCHIITYDPAAMTCRSPLESDEVMVTLPGELLSRKSTIHHHHIPDGATKDDVILTADDLHPFSFPHILQNGSGLKAT